MVVLFWLSFVKEQLQLCDEGTVTVVSCCCSVCRLSFMKEQLQLCDGPVLVVREGTVTVV